MTKGRRQKGWVGKGGGTDEKNYLNNKGFILNGGSQPQKSWASSE